MALPIFKLALLAGAGYYFFNRYRNARPTGSTTNASEAIDDIEVGENADRDELLDAGVKETFPASDPVAVNPLSETAYEKNRRGKL